MDVVLAVAAGGVCANVHECTVWDISVVCARVVIFDLRPSEVLYSTPMRIAGCYLKQCDNSLPICVSVQ